MAESTREVYVVSDVHLGGANPTTDDPEDRGFRICTHTSTLARFIDALSDKPQPIEVIVNGDLVDFLAERPDDGHWTAFRPDQAVAARCLETMMDRDADLFSAFARLLAKGHRLTLLLGNHDIELTLPLVRRTLEARLGVTGKQDFHFIYDGEAYTCGSAIIEHGNRYDAWNVVDYDGLRRFRSLLSRRQPIPSEYEFQAPAGSHMVASVINPIKTEYRFIDLLKPENDAMVPLLMALEPGYRRVLSTVATLAAATHKHRLKTAAMPSFGGDISSSSDDLGSFGSDISSMEAPAADPLDALVRDVMKGDAGLVLGALATADPLASIGSDISTYETIDRSLGFARLLFARSDGSVARRLPALLATVRAVQTDATFARDAECLTEYLNAASDLASTGGYEFVVFGHTHLARDVSLGGGARYVNTGTWADLIRFPNHIVAGPEPQALEALRAFVEDLGAGRLKGWTSFLPTYAKLVVDGDRVVSAALCDYASPANL